MRVALCIAWREFASLFRVPVGWIVLALYAGLWGVMFVQFVLVPGAPASLRPLFSTAGWLMLPIAPAISMRLVSDELRTGSYETLATAPVGELAIAAGKFFGAAMFLAVMLACTLPMVVVLFAVSDPPPDAGPVLAGYLSVGLLGLLFLSVGLLASALTSSQTLAFLGTMIALLGWLLGTTVGLRHAPPWLAGPLERVSITSRLQGFAKGVIDTGDVAFFVLAAGVFVLACAMTLSARRWL